MIATASIAPIKASGLRNLGALLAPTVVKAPVPAAVMGLPAIGFDADGKPDAATLALGRHYMAYLLDPETLARVPQTSEGAALIALALLAQTTEVSS